MMDSAIRRRTRKIDAALWSEIQKFLSDGNSIAEAARQFLLTAPAISYRLQHPPQTQIVKPLHDLAELEDEMEVIPARKDRKATRRLPAPLASWAFPKVEAEALGLVRACFRGQLGIRETRALIRIDAEARADLDRLVAVGQLSERRVQLAVQFRAAVAEEFERMLDLGPAVVDRRPRAFRHRGQPRSTRTASAVM